MTRFLPAKPGPKFANSGYNGLTISIDKWDGNPNINLGCYPAIRAADGTIQTEITNGKNTIIGQMKRLNRKALAAIQETAWSDITNRVAESLVWQAVDASLARFDMVVDGPLANCHNL